MTATPRPPGGGTGAPGPMPGTARPNPAPARTHVIIPARLASTRFPRKVLADRTGKPLVQHVYEQAIRSRTAASVTVAVDDDEVRRALQAFATPTVMTRVDHPNGSSRLAEAADALAIADADIVVNVQGDEPELDPAVIDAVAEALERMAGPGPGLAAAGPRATIEFPAARTADVATCATPIEDDAERLDPNVVKVVTDLAGLALYFSRSRIPFERDRGASAPGNGGGGGGVEVLKHIGIYAYRAQYLRRYVHLTPTPLERAEMLEQLRILEHGGRIAVARVNAHSRGIDTPEQYDAFVRRYLDSKR